MTVSDITRRTSVVGNATAGQQVDFDFPVASTDEIYVKTRVTATGAESAWMTETTDYSVTINEDIGGYVTMVSAVAATSEIHVVRYSDLNQNLDLAQGGTFNAELLEDALDKTTRQIIENKDGLNRTLTIPVTDDPDLDMELPNSIDRAEAFLYFDASGEPTAVNAIDAGAVVVSPFAETYLDDANAAATLTTLGISAFVQTILNDAAATNVLTTLGFSTLVQGAIDETTLSGFLTAIGVDSDIITLLDDTTISGFLDTAGVNTVDEILCYEGDVLTYDDDVLTWKS